MEVYNNKKAVLNYMWPRDHAYQDIPSEMWVQGGLSTYPPDQPHLIDVVGAIPTNPGELSGSWPRTYTEDILEVALRYDGIMNEVTQHLHENNRGASASNIMMVSALLEMHILDIPVPMLDSHRSYMFAFPASSPSIESCKRQ